MASVAVERPLGEGIRALGIHFGWQHPFTIATSMPHIHGGSAGFGMGAVGGYLAVVALERVTTRGSRGSR